MRAPDEVASGSPDVPDVVLADPVRQRLVHLAADVLGRLAADDVPGSLRAFARFAPAKRARLGAAALAAALDADADFRQRVADVVAEASPQLVESLREGASTSASDPIDTAVLAYLVRPDGWSAIVASATDRWAEHRASRDAGVGERARLRAEIADLRRQLKAATANTQEAVSAASAEASAAAEQLRRALRSRTGELRAAQRARDETQADVAAMRAGFAAAEAEHDAQVQRLSARVRELERGADNARRDTRIGRDVDEARLRLLLDTMTEAAAGLRRELSLPAGTMRPADAVALALSSEHGRADATHTATDARVLDRLLELPQVHLIVDGYNVTKTAYPELPLVDQRARLVGSLAALQARSGAEITIAFDGSVKPPIQARPPRGVRVLFSAIGELADDLIRSLIAAEPPGRPVVVVTSDREIVSDVRAAGAWTAASAVLVARLGGG